MIEELQVRIDPWYKPEELVMEWFADLDCGLEGFVRVEVEVDGWLETRGVRLSGLGVLVMRRARVGLES